MTRYRPPVPHTPPPTSRPGDALRVSRNGLPWALRDARGLIHTLSHQGHTPLCGYHYDERLGHITFEDTLADITCLWCIAGTQRQ